MMRRIALLIATIGFAAAPPAAADDQFTLTTGGYGGVPFVLRCPQGSMMTGIAGYTGAYFDGIAPICNGAELPQKAGNTRQRRVTASCPGGSYVEQLNIWTLATETRLVDSLQLFCRGRLDNRRNGSVSIMTTDGAAGSKSGTGIGEYAGSRICPANTVTVGLQGASGKSIDRIGLICATR